MVFDNLRWWRRRPPRRRCDKQLCGMLYARRMPIKSPYSKLKQIIIIFFGWFSLNKIPNTHTHTRFHTDSHARSQSNGKKMKGISFVNSFMDIELINNCMRRSFKMMKMAFSRKKFQFNLIALWIYAFFVWHFHLNLCPCPIDAWKNRPKEKSLKKMAIDKSWT